MAKYIGVTIFILIFCFNTIHSEELHWFIEDLKNIISSYAAFFEKKNEISGITSRVKDTDYNYTGLSEILKKYPEFKTRKDAVIYMRKTSRSLPFNLVENDENITNIIEVLEDNDVPIESYIEEINDLMGIPQIQIDICNLPSAKLLKEMWIYGLPGKETLEQIDKVIEGIPDLKNAIDLFNQSPEKFLLDVAFRNKGFNENCLKQ